jgi:hypothetical protein
MNDAQRRAFVAGLYRGPRWQRRVSLMSDAQVYAIYMAKQKYDEEHKLEQKEEKKDDDIPF